MVAATTASLTGCSNGKGTTDVCVPLQTIHAFDASTDALGASSASWPERQRTLQQSAPTISRAYGSAISAAPPRYAASLRTLKSLSDKLFIIGADSSDASEFQSKLEAAVAGSPALDSQLDELERWVQSTCGFQLRS
jgi:hypothetical protein